MSRWMPVWHTIQITNLRESERRLAVGHVLWRIVSPFGVASRCVRWWIDGIGPKGWRLVGGLSFSFSALSLAHRRENESKYD